MGMEEREVVAGMVEERRGVAAVVVVVDMVLTILTIVTNLIVLTAIKEQKTLVIHRQEVKTHLTNI